MRNLAILLTLATAMVAASAPGASAHGGERLFGETANGTGTFGVAYGRFRTERVHRVHVVRVCLQLRRAPGRRRALDCGAIVIADNGTGDLLLVLGEGDDVVWWDHETGDVEPVRVKWA